MLFLIKCIVKFMKERRVTHTDLESKYDIPDALKY
jgi:hypothetical protein